MLMIGVLIVTTEAIMWLDNLNDENLNDKIQYQAYAYTCVHILYLYITVHTDTIEQ